MALLGASGLWRLIFWVEMRVAAARWLRCMVRLCSQLEELWLARYHDVGSLDNDKVAFVISRRCLNDTVI